MAESNFNLYQAPVNNNGLDPLQGFDFEIWCQDTATGKIAWFGRFQTLTLSIRDATETYLEVGQRIPTYLNGEIQIAWVLEQGLVDMAFLVRTFGVDKMRRDQYVTRGPRFQIAFDANASELNPSKVGDRSDPSLEYRLGAGSQGLFTPDSFPGDSNTLPITGSRTPQGRYELQRCKVDSVSLGVMAGRRAAAVRWEGVAEGYTFIPQTIQQFKTQRFESGRSFGAPTQAYDIPTVPTGGSSNSNSI